MIFALTPLRGGWWGSTPLAAKEGGMPDGWLDEMNPASILIVEDEAIIARAMERQLHKLGYRVIGAVSTGNDALSSVSRHRPDLILVDIHIRGEMDGIELVTALRKIIPAAVVYMTALVDDETLQRSMDTHPDGYLIKPFGELDFKAAVTLALGDRAPRISSTLSPVEQVRVEIPVDVQRTFLSHVCDPACCIRDDLILSAVNPAFTDMAMYRRDEIEGLLTFEPFFASEDLDQMLRYHLMRRHNPANVPAQYRARFVPRVGPARSVMISVSLVPRTGISVLSLSDPTG